MKEEAANYLKEKIVLFLESLQTLDPIGVIGLAVALGLSVLVMKRLSRRIGYKTILWNVIAVMALLEICFLFFLNNPGALRFVPGLFDEIHALYFGYDRSIVQYQEKCSQYDEELSYLLRPGSCKIKNREYEIEYQINSLGLRDDEESLEKPEVVILGDSHAMGFAVGQEDTFASLVEKQTGLKVLNAGMSSYGTAREMMLLNRLDTSALKYLVIQYGSNDLDENREFLKGGGALETMSEEKYRFILNKHKLATFYYPGKFVLLNFRLMLNRILQDENKGYKETQGEEQAVNNFLGVLKLTEKNIPGHLKAVIFVHIDGCLNSGNFMDLLRQKIAASGLSSVFKHSIFINPEDISSEEYCYVLDDHLNVAGNRGVATAISKAIHVAEEEFRS